MKKFIMIFLVGFFMCVDANTYIVGGSADVHVDVDNAYHLVKYFANYKQLLVDFTVVQNIEFVLISDKRVEKPDEGCPATSLYCTKLSSKRIIEVISVCVDEIYIHIFPNPSNRYIRATIKTDYIKNAPCNDIDRNPTNFCPLLSPSECLDRCSSGCGLLSCQHKRSIENQNIFQLCLKESMEDDKLKEICDSHSESNTFKWKICETKESNSNWLIGIVVSILISILLFGGVVVYYHKMMQKYGRPPFSVPRFCPRRLFPRPDQEEAENLRVIQ